MAERKLNFNVPLLSTSRIQKTAAVSMRRNKTNKFTDYSETNDCSSVLLLVPQMGLDQVSEAASVPFTWEQAPGRSKGINFRPQEVFTPGKVMDILKCPMEKAIDGNLTRLQSSMGKQVENSEDEDDVFSDAPDRLSMKDSFSINHSINAVTGYGAIEMKTPLNLYDDPQSLDFMLNRFLPAAKAMTMEQPHYASNRKPLTFMSEPTIQIRGLVPEEKKQTSNRYDESILSPYHQDRDEEEIEEDDEVFEYAYLSKKGCGMLSQLCFTDSLGMLNTVLGFKAKSSSPITSPSHDQVKSSKVFQLKSSFRSAKKLALDSVSKHKLGGKVQSPVHQSVRKRFNSESNLTSSESRASSTFRGTANSSPFYPAGFPETHKETENLRANRLKKHIRNISWSQELLYPKSNGSTSSLLEKTVNVNTENIPMTNDQQNSNTNPDLEASENISGKTVKGDELEKINRSPPGPPSPKKPSKSWLLQNLPPVSSQIPSRRYPFNPQKQDLKENSKWETIVKTSYTHRDHIRYSEELVAHTSHQSKT